MVHRLVIALALAVLAGCAAPTPFVAGLPAYSPPGWVAYCLRPATIDPACNNTPEIRK